MRRLLFSCLTWTATFSQPVFAQDLIPATNEDIQEFDRQVERHIQERPKPRADNFGAIVSEEAKSLKSAEPEERKRFGKWVSEQRKKRDQGRPSSEGSLGSDRKDSERLKDRKKDRKHRDR